MAERTNIPTGSMKSAAQRALDWHNEGKRGGTSIGLARANQIVNGTNLSDSTVKRMYSFFSRHEVDKKATGFSSGEEGYPSPGRVAWDLWGGDSGFSWSRAKAASMKKSIQKDGSVGSSVAKGMDELMGMDDMEQPEDDWAGLNERQSDQAEALCMIVEEYGQYDQSSGPDGSHYGDGSKNPFKSDGLQCSSCIFYEQGACHLVSGVIDPQGVCKLWIIPESALQDSMQNSELEKRDYNTKQRRAMSNRGQAMPDGSYPIANRTDLENAIQSFGRAKHPTSVKRHIITRARALGLSDILPESWKTKKNVSVGFQGIFLPE